MDNALPKHYKESFLITVIVREKILQKDAIEAWHLRTAGEE